MLHLSFETFWDDCKWFFDCFPLMRALLCCGWMVLIDSDSGLGRATPPRRAASPGMGSASSTGRHLPSPSGPGSLPHPMMSKRRNIVGFDDGASDISSTPSSIFGDYNGEKICFLFEIFCVMRLQSRMDLKNNTHNFKRRDWMSLESPRLSVVVVNSQLDLLLIRSVSNILIQQVLASINNQLWSQIEVSCSMLLSIVFFLVLSTVMQNRKSSRRLRGAKRSTFWFYSEMLVASFAPYTVTILIQKLSLNCMEPDQRTFMM